MSERLTSNLYVWGSANDGRHLMVTDHDTGLRLTLSMIQHAHWIKHMGTGEVLKDRGFFSPSSVPNRLSGVRVTPCGEAI